jgi:hypothetical protein
LELKKLQKLRDLNIELLETLTQTFSAIKGHAEKHQIPFPTEDRFSYLIQRTIILIQEINEEVALPTNFQHLFHTKSRKLPRFNFDDENPDELPKPIVEILIS